MEIEGEALEVHFGKLLHDARMPDRVEAIGIREDITEEYRWTGEEVLREIQKMKPNKARGTSFINAELLKRAGTEFFGKCLAMIFNRCR